MLSYGQEEDHDEPYPAEFRERAVQMVLDHLDSYASLTGALRDIAGKLGCSPDSLRVWYKQARRDAGKEAGPARVTIDGTAQLVSENQSVYIPLGAVHRMENPGKVPLTLIEVQTGTYLAEDDIIRYEDG